MLSPLLICLIPLLVLVYLLYGRPEHKDFVQVSVTALAVFWTAMNVIPTAEFTRHANLRSPSYPVRMSSIEPARNVDPATGRKYELLPTSIPDPVSSNIDYSATCGIDHGGCGSTRPEAVPVAVLSGRTDFCWPARGRIIQKFAQGGDGINIALREGTQVKAAEEGEVAFAGGQLTGYGKMILIRHPNGYVTAYAHNSELKVAKGDKVTRGQTIALSGQTGNVGSPQLHFELRHGASAVDPMHYFSM